MRRLAAAALTALVALAALGCSKSSSGEPTPDRALTGVSSGAVSTLPSTEAPLASAGPVLTPEDAEAETEHRITEQNLESELDRLEREIQAE